MIYSSFTTTSSVELGLDKFRIGEGSLFDLPHMSGSFLQHFRCSCGFIMFYSSFTTTSSAGLGCDKFRIGEGSLIDLPHMSGRFLKVPAARVAHH